jgi:hypothetical protein
MQRSTNVRPSLVARTPNSSSTLWAEAPTGVACAMPTSTWTYIASCSAQTCASIPASERLEQRHYLVSIQKRNGTLTYHPGSR